MKSRANLFFVFLLGAVAGVGGMRLIDSPAVAQPAKTETEATLAKVVQVNHGDEFVILWRPPVPMRFAVRLNRVDTPFSNRAGGREAAEALADLIYGKQVRIEFEDANKPLQDRSQRMIAYAHVDGKNVGVEMIRTGHGEFFTRFGKGIYAEQMQAAQDEAKAAKRGQWAESDD
jgi:endonuclease YncB( thermonuclease family)